MLGPYSIVTDISCTVWVKIYPKKKNYNKTYKKYKKKFYYSHFIFLVLYINEELIKATIITVNGKSV